MNVTENEPKDIFNQPVEQVAASVATTWRRYENRKLVLPGDGEGKILVVRAGSVTRFLRLEDVVAYTSKYTMDRWPKSHGPEIANLETATIIGYKSHTSILSFGKVGGLDSAANIQFNLLRELDRFGEPLPGKDEDVVIGPAKFSSLIGLADRGRAFLTSFNLRNSRPAWLLTVGSRQLTPEELTSIEEEILSGDFQ